MKEVGLPLPARSYEDFNRAREDPCVHPAPSATSDRLPRLDARHRAPLLRTFPALQGVLLGHQELRVRECRQADRSPTPFCVVEQRRKRAAVLHSSRHCSTQHGAFLGYQLTQARLSQAARIRSRQPGSCRDV